MTQLSKWFNHLLLTQDLQTRYIIHYLQRNGVRQDKTTLFFLKWLTSRYISPGVIQNAILCSWDVDYILNILVYAI